MTPDFAEIGRRLDNAAASLMEHVGSVQILVTFRDGRETRAMTHGAGDFYARVGLAREWVAGQRAVTERQYIDRYTGHGTAEDDD